MIFLRIKRQHSTRFQ